MLSLEKERLWGDLIAASEMGLYIRACCARTRGNGLKLKEGFRLDIRNGIFTMRAMKHYNGLPRDMEDPWIHPWKHSRSDWLVLSVTQSSTREVPAHTGVG